MAGVSIGLAAVFVLALLAVVGVWRLFRHADESAQSATRAAQEVEALARRLELRPGAGPPLGSAEFDQLRDDSARLLEEQRRLQEVARNLLDTASQAGPAAALADLEAAVGRLDATVGQMAASLANLIQLLERQGRR